jgi:hypothetical protein
MQKPPPCYQDWDAMKEVSGGRLCEQCENTIVDFSKTTWEDILAKQKESNYSTCGKYSEKQIRHWGHQPPAIDMRWFHKFSFTSLFVLLGLKSVDAQITNDVKIEQISQDRVVQINDTIELIEFRGVLLYSPQNKPVAYAALILPEQSGGGYTDSSGKFILKVPLDIIIDGIVEIRYSYPGYSTTKAKLYQDSLNQLWLSDKDAVPSANFRVVEKESKFKTKFLKPFRKIGNWFRRD